MCVHFTYTTLPNPQPTHTNIFYWRRDNINVRHAKLYNTPRARLYQHQHIVHKIHGRACGSARTHTWVCTSYTFCRLLCLLCIQNLVDLIIFRWNQWDGKRGEWGSACVCLWFCIVCVRVRHMVVLRDASSKDNIWRIFNQNCMSR